MVGRRGRHPGWSRAGVAAALAGLLALAAPGRARAGSAPPCSARVEIAPARAFVGQPVLHRSVVVHDEGVDVEWTQPLRFPGFRSESLSPGSADRVARGGDGGAEPELETAVKIEVPTWLFAARPGRLDLPPGRLRCGEHEIEVPAPPFEALPLPTDGRPGDFDGVVGPVDVDASSEPEVALGGAVRVHVTSRGSANLWRAAPSLRVDPPETEVFAREPRITMHEGRSGLRVVRHDAFDLVPRQAGTLHVAPVRIAHLDPGSGRYRSAQTQPLEIRVVAAAEPAPAAAGTPSAPARSERGPAASRGPWIALAGLTLAAAAVGLASRRRRRAGDPVHAALRDYDRADDRDARSAALERALRARLRERGGAPPGSTPQPGVEGSPDPIVAECLRALETLERARFGGTEPGADFDARLASIRARVARTGDG